MLPNEGAEHAAHTYCISCQIAEVTVQDVHYLFWNSKQGRQRGGPTKGAMQRGEADQKGGVRRLGPPADTPALT